MIDIEAIRIKREYGFEGLKCTNDHFISLYSYINGCLNFSEFNTFADIPTGSTGVTVTQGNSYCYLSKKLL